MIKTVTSALNVRADQARQFILKFGLAQDKVEGQVFKALDSTLESYASELSKSIRFFKSEYMDAPVGGIILSGFAGMIIRQDSFLKHLNGKNAGNDQV